MFLSKQDSNWLFARFVVCYKEPKKLAGGREKKKKLSVWEKFLYACVLLGFPSTLNSIQPHISAVGLTDTYRTAAAAATTGLVCCCICQQTDLRGLNIHGALSDVLSSSTGSPQARVLSPLLLGLYTSESRRNCENRHLIKFADDTVIVPLLSHNDPDRGSLVV